MADLGFVPLDEAGFELMRKWFTDPELLHRVGYPSWEWFDTVTEIEWNCAWLVFEGGQAVGHVQLMTSPDPRMVSPDITGTLGVFVRPDLRRHGIGRRLIEQALARPEVKHLARLGVWIDADNVAALHCFQDAGFSLSGTPPTDNGTVELEFLPSANSA